MCFISPSKPTKRRKVSEEGEEESQVSKLCDVRHVGSDGVCLETGFPPPSCSLALVKGHPTSSPGYRCNGIGTVGCVVGSKKGVVCSMGDGGGSAVSSPVAPLAPPRTSLATPQTSLGAPRSSLGTSPAPAPLLWIRGEPDSCSRVTPVDRLKLKNPISNISAAANEEEELRVYPDVELIVAAFGLAPPESPECLAEHAERCGCPLCRAGLGVVCIRSHDIAGCCCSVCMWGVDACYSASQQ